TVTEGHLEYYSDGLHLTTLGNQFIAEEIYQHLRH
ncbi:esterase, partial [Streptococcus suis]